MKRLTLALLYLRMAITAVLSLFAAVYTLHSCSPAPAHTVRVSCDMASFHPDFTTAQREACRQLRINQPRS
jgi:hypothetical protein